MLLGHLNDRVKLLEAVRSIIDGEGAILDKLEPSAIHGNGRHI